MDCPLFNRLGRTIELTDAGTALLPLARGLVKRSLEITETMESLKGQVYGHLRLCSSTSPGKYVLPQLLAAFHHQHPLVTFTCHVTSEALSMQKLEAGEVHFSMTGQEGSPRKDIEFHEFNSDTIQLIAPLNHPWAEKTSLEPRELCGGLFIQREEDSGTRQAVIDGLHSVGIAEADLQVLITLENSEAIAMAVAAGIGVGFASKLVISRLVPGQVKFVPVQGLEIARKISIARKTGLPTSTAQAAFWDCISNFDHPHTQAKMPVVY